MSRDVYKRQHLEGDNMCDLLHTSEFIYHIYEEKKIESHNLHGTEMCIRDSCLHHATSFCTCIFENTRSIIKYRINTDSLLEYRK